MEQHQEMNGMLARAPRAVNGRARLQWTLFPTRLFVSGSVLMLGLVAFWAMFRGAQVVSGVSENDDSALYSWCILAIVLSISFVFSAVADFRAQWKLDRRS